MKNTTIPIIAVAPMIDWTTRHYRYFMRQITKHSMLYTEMLVADAILHGNCERLLGYHPTELPLIVQLGGSDPNKLALASKTCQNFGYSGINLNVGCPSHKVKSGNFGACLMHNPQLVAQCIKSMQDVVSIPVSIKHRIGLDDNNDYAYLSDFVGIIADTGCKDFIIHARNAIMTGLSPKQNREIPPLKYDYVYRLKEDFPELNISINGGIKTFNDIDTHLQHVDGVMIGREAYHNPYLFSEIDNAYFGHNSHIKTRIEIATSMLPYLEHAIHQGIPPHHITMHMLGLYHATPHAKHWRQTLTSIMRQANSLESYKALLATLIT